MTEGMKGFTDDELRALELAFETLSDTMVGLLGRSAFTRQTNELVDAGAKASPRYREPAEKHSGNNFVKGGPSTRTVVLYDNFKPSGAALTLMGAGTAPA